MNATEHTAKILRQNVKGENRLSRTTAYIASRALRKSATEQSNTAAQIRDEFPNAAHNCEMLAKWYIEAADALSTFDEHGIDITRGEATSE